MSTATPRELGVDPVTHLSALSTSPSWLDLCGGEGGALREVELTASAVLTGSDRVADAGPDRTGRPAAARQCAVPPARTGRDEKSKCCVGSSICAAS